MSAPPLHPHPCHPSFQTTIIAHSTCFKQVLTGHQPSGLPFLHSNCTHRSHARRTNFLKCKSDSVILLIKPHDGFPFPSWCSSAWKPRTALHDPLPPRVSSAPSLEPFVTECHAHPGSPGRVHCKKKKPIIFQDPVQASPPEVF